ncbi:flagellar hook assembly protein FlgD [candidate division KSB1 bacterium]|nr:flagellar hook assembly protein FlgD [candidate division KSB1 bacterium]
MDVNVTDIASQQTDTASLSNLYANQDVLNKDSFLQLLVTQLRHQDPLDPMENTEFVAQLAQFSSLEQMQNVSSGISDLSVLMQSVNNSLSTELLGKNVKYMGNSFSMTDGQDGSMNFYLESNANVKITIYDENESVVAKIARPELDGGAQTVTWDGKNIDGEQVPEGRYTFDVEATDSNGDDVNVATFAVDKVTGLKFDSGNAVLVLPEKEIYLGDILEIMEPK